MQPTEGDKNTLNLQPVKTFHHVSCTFGIEIPFFFANPKKKKKTKKRKYRRKCSSWIYFHPTLWPSTKTPRPMGTASKSSIVISEMTWNVSPRWRGVWGGWGFHKKNPGSKSNGRRFFPFWIGEIRSKRNDKFITDRFTRNIIHLELKSPKV